MYFFSTTVCHISCANSCTHGGANGCDDCKDGWLLGDDDHCQGMQGCSGGSKGGVRGVRTPPEIPGEKFLHMEKLPLFVDE